jgi:hypothetical protein
VWSVAIGAYPSLAVSGRWNERSETGSQRSRLPGATLNHPEQGSLGVDEVRRIMAHEIEHHTTDLVNILST